MKALAIKYSSSNWIISVSKNDRNNENKEETIIPHTLDKDWYKPAICALYMKPFKLMHFLHLKMQDKVPKYQLSNELTYKLLIWEA